MKRKSENMVQLKENLAVENINPVSAEQLEEHGSLDKLFLKSSKTLFKVEEDKSNNASKLVKNETNKKEVITEPGLQVTSEQNDEKAEQDFTDDILLMNHHKKEDA